ncbi:HAD family hydrolase [Angustibacter luteus]|uniref:HAD family hydrolase n=1 Tax=Angustibacter luteus TaxID=658456 RepID=A0ABW1JIZ1_9ACTN
MSALRAGLDGVLLDIDDTLVDTHASFRAGMAAVASDYLPHLQDDGPQLALAHWHADERGFYPRFVAGDIDFLQQRRLRAEAMQQDLGGPALDDASFERWNAIYDSAFRQAWVALPGAVELLHALTASGVPFGAVTNHVVGYQRDKLERTGLSQLRIVVGTDTLGVGKPERAVFRHACALIGCEPDRTVYVGNDLAVDAEGALDAGLQAVWLDRGIDHRGAGSTVAPPPAAGVSVLHDLGELFRWLGLAAADLGPGAADR